MKEFLLYASKGVTSSDFTLKDLPGSGGRMDLISRSIISALWISRSLRRDTRIYVTLNGPPSPPLTLLFDSQYMQKVTPDERNIAIWIKKTLQNKEQAEKNEWLEPYPGIYLSKKSFFDLLNEYQGKTFYILHENGLDIRNTNISKNPVFIVGDHIGLPENMLDHIKTNYDTKCFSLGMKSYFTSQSITIVHNELDRREL